MAQEQGFVASIREDGWAEWWLRERMPVMIVEQVIAVLLSGPTLRWLSRL